MKYINEIMEKKQYKINKMKNSLYNDEINSILEDTFKENIEFQLYSVFLSVIDHLKKELQTLNKIEFLGGRKKLTPDLELKSIKLKINDFIFYLTIIDNVERVFSTVINNHHIPIFFNLNENMQMIYPIKTKYLSLFKSKQLINLEYYDLDELIYNDEIIDIEEEYDADEIIYNDIVDNNYFLYTTMSDTSCVYDVYTYYRNDYYTLNDKNEIYNRIVFNGIKTLFLDIGALFDYCSDKYDDKIKETSFIQIDEPDISLQSILVERKFKNID